MKIISFSWTTPALLAGQKFVTRRDWKPTHALRFTVGERVQAWDRSPRVGGKLVAIIELTEPPFYANSYPDYDYLAEGFEYLHQHPASGAPDFDEVWRTWQRDRPYLWMVRFKLVEITKQGGK